MAVTRRQAFLAAGTAATLLPGIVAARQQTSLSDPVVPLFLCMPTPGGLGDGWALLGEWDALPTNARAFVAGLGHVYGGPAGRLLKVIVLRHKTDRGSILGAWEEATGWVDEDRYRWGASFEYERIEELRDAPPPSGVADAYRLDGRENNFGGQIAFGFYAIEPDLIAYLVVLETGLERDGMALTRIDDLAPWIAAQRRRS